MSIGQTLAAARREAGLSIDDVSAKTRLRATVIRAIENDDFSLCGGDFYAKGHIRTLAALVGADPAGLAAEYDASVARPDDVPIASQVFETEAAGRAISRRADRRAPNWGAAAVAMVLVAVIAIAAVQLLGGKSHSGSPTPVAVAGTSTSPPPTSPAPSVSTVAPSGSTAAKPAVSPPTSAVAEAGVHVVVRVTTATCWLLASASNGSVIYQGLLQPGDTKTFDDPQKVSLRLGNAPATDLTVNGVEIGPPPSTTSVASVSFGPGNPTAGQG